MGDRVLLGKLAIGLAGLVFGLALLAQPRVFTTSSRHFYVTSWLALLTSRLLVFVVLFGLLGFEAQSDVATVYYPQAKVALAGQVPYRDFASSYAPLFSYVAAVAVWVWDSPKSLILLAVLFEAAAFPLWTQFASRMFEDKTARSATIFYLTSALPMVNVAVDGQNQIWASLFLAASLCFLVANQSAWSGFAFSLSLSIVKFLPVIFLPAYLFSSPKRLTWLVGAAVAPLLVYGLFVLRGVDILFPIKAEGADATSGNLPFLIAAISPAMPDRVFVALTLIALFAAYLWMIRGIQTRISPRAAIFMIVVIQFALLIFSKKAYTNYLTISFFPICLAVATAQTRSVGRSFLFFACFSTIAVVEPSMWFRWLGRQPLAIAWSNMSLDGVSQLRFAGFLGVELVMLGFYAVYAVKSSTLCRRDVAAQSNRAFIGSEV